MGAGELSLLIPIASIVGVFLTAIVGLIAKSCSECTRLKHTEASRRDIAAYVAEGSMTPEEGERLLAAGQSKKG